MNGAARLQVLPHGAPAELPSPDEQARLSDHPSAIAERLQHLARFLAGLSELMRVDKNPLSITVRNSQPVELPVELFEAVVSDPDTDQDDIGSGVVAQASREYEHLVLRIDALVTTAEAYPAEVELCIGRGVFTGGSRKTDHPVLVQRVTAQTDPIGNGIILSAAGPVSPEPGVLNAMVSGSSLSEALKASAEFESAELIQHPDNRRFLTVVDALTPECELDQDHYVAFLRRKPGAYGDYSKRLVKAASEGKLTDSALVAFVANEPSKMPLDAWPEWNEWSARFPMPSNAEQASVLTRLSKSTCVAVHGPPGTGKTFTIINLLAHLLSQGKRVLVTSQKSNALEVLVNPARMAPELRDLCFLVVTANAETRKRIRDQIKEIDRRLSNRDLDAAAAAETRELLVRELDDVIAARRQVLERWSQIADEERQVHPSPFGELTLEDLARHVVAGPRLPDWIGPDAECPLSDDELRRLEAAARAVVPGDRQRAADVRATPEALPTNRRLAEMWTSSVELHHRLGTHASSIGDLALFAGAPRPAIDRAARCLDLTIARAHLLQARWLRTMAEQERQHPERWERFLGSLLTEVRDLIGHRSGRHEAIELGDAGPHEPLARATHAAMARRRNNRNLRAVLRQPDSPLQKVTIGGRPLRQWRDIGALSDELKRREQIESLRSSWNAECTAVLGAPPIGVSTPIGVLHQLESHLESAVEALKWTTEEFPKARQAIASIGLRVPPPSDLVQIDAVRAALNSYPDAVRSAELERELRAIEGEVRRFRSGLPLEPAAEQLLRGVTTRSLSDIDAARVELGRLLGLQPVAIELRTLLHRLSGIAPRWSAELANGRPLEAEPTAPWKRSQGAAILDRFRVHEPVPSLPAESERADVVRQLVEIEAWAWALARMNSDGRVRDLRLWAERLNGRRRDTNGEEVRKLAEVLQHLPAVIMPIDEVMRTFDPMTTQFDVVIVDESSQCDVRSLGVLGLAKRAIVVGDDLQTSAPSFTKDADLDRLAQTHLGTVPTAGVLQFARSLYSVARLCVPPAHQAELEEHFRCAPEIIGFSNEFAYDGRIKPLERQPSIPLVLRAQHLEHGRRSNEGVNEAEAQWIANDIADLCRGTGAWAGVDTRPFTIGIISTSSAQIARHRAAIEAALADALGESFEPERSKRRLKIATAFEFQGDERDVVYLTFVVSEHARFGALASESDRKRMNVAVSRASKALTVVHSAPAAKFLEQDVRGALLRYIARTRETPHHGELHPLLAGAADDLLLREPLCTSLGLDAVTADGSVGRAVLDSRRVTTSRPTKRIERLARASALLPTLVVERASARVAGTGR